MERKERSDYMTRGYFMVKDVLMKAGGQHLCADDIYEELKKNGRSIGLTTVYRQLDRLVHEGYVRRVSTDRAGSCYSYIDECCTEHYHMICNLCGKLAHLSCDHVEELFHHIKTEHGFQIDAGKTVLYGLCASCLRERKRKEKNGDA